MKVLSKILTNYIILNGIIKPHERTIYEYGFLVFFEKLFFIIVCFTISIFLHRIPEGMLFFLIFIPLRSYAGGLHLKTYFSCFLLSIFTFCMVIMVDNYLYIPIFICFTIFIALEILVYYMYPVENVNRIVDANENKYFKNKLLHFLFIDNVLVLFCVFLKKEYIQTITMTLLVITITMAIGKYQQLNQ